MRQQLKKFPNLHRITNGSLLMCLCLSLGNVFANEEGGSNVEKFEPNYFMAFEPQTLYEVLESIPAANRVLLDMGSASDSRGFGSDGDQILINGKRVSGKENSLDNELDNILAQEVAYVELIRGTRSDLDVQSEGLVINVVLKQLIEASMLWSLGGKTTKGLSTKPHGSFVYSNGFDKFKYRLGAEHYINPTQFTVSEQFLDADAKLTHSFQRQRKNWYIKNSISGKFEYEYSPQTAWQLNALYQKYYTDGTYTTDQTYWPTIQQTTNVLVYDWGTHNWEVSGDITHDLDDNNHFKLLFISNEIDADEKLLNYNLLDEDERVTNYRLPRLFVGKENVLRGNWRHTVDDKHVFNSGVEAAINTRDEKVQFIRDSGDFYRSTELNDIEEQRYEVFVNHNYAIKGNLHLQSSLEYETSTLKVATQYQLETDSLQVIDNQSSRTFSYLKPRLNLRYDYDNQHQIRLNYQCTVSQLNLYDFVPEFNSDEARLEETNPDLKPEVRNEFSASFEKQWPDSQASFTLSPYYHKVSDLITEIPLTSYSGDGNIANAKEYGVRANSHFGLHFIGLDDTFVSASYTLRDSEAIHPFTGQKDKINGFSDNEWNVKINQTDLLPGLSFSLTFAKDSAYSWARYDYEQQSTSDITANGFMDYQINKHLKIRLKGDNLFNREYGYSRQRHAGLYTANELSRIEQREYYFESRYSLTLSGQF